MVVFNSYALFKQTLLPQMKQFWWILWENGLEGVFVELLWGYSICFLSLLAVCLFVCLFLWIKALEKIIASALHAFSTCNWFGCFLNPGSEQRDFPGFSGTMESRYNVSQYNKVPAITNGISQPGQSDSETVWNWTRYNEPGYNEISDKTNTNQKPKKPQYFELNKRHDARSWSWIPNRSIEIAADPKTRTFLIVKFG